MPSSTGSGTPQTASCWNFPSRRASSGHNADYARLRLDTAGSMELGYRSDLMDGTPVITGTAIDGKGAKSTFTAIPYYAFGNRGNGGYRVWLPTR